MQSEKQFLEGVAKILLRPLRNKKYGITRASVAKDGHFNSMMLTPNKLMEMKAKTLVRLMLYLCTGTLSEEEFLSICLKAASQIYGMANKNSGIDAYNIIDNHAGSPLKK